MTAALSRRNAAWAVEAEADILSRFVLSVWVVFRLPSRFPYFFWIWERSISLLSTERTPGDYTVPELFHDGELPSAFSDNWDAPAGVTDLRLLTGPGKTPVLAFTALEAGAEYAITRTADGESVEIAALRGEPGQELRFADEALDLSREAEYAVLPRNALLYERGILLTGPRSDAVRYAPGGLLNTIMGVGRDEAPPTPAEIEFEPEESLFS